MKFKINDVVSIRDTSSHLINIYAEMLNREIHSYHLNRFIIRMSIDDGDFPCYRIQYSQNLNYDRLISEDDLDFFDKQINIENNFADLLQI